MFCPSCNASNREDAKFCKSCGRPLHSTQDSMPGQAQAASAPTTAEQPAAEPAEQSVLVETAPPPEQRPVASAPEEDLALEQTLVLGPEAISAYRNRLWRQTEEGPAQRTGASAPLAASTSYPADISYTAESSDSSDPIDLPPLSALSPTDPADLPTLPATHTPDAGAAAFHPGTPPAQENPSDPSGLFEGSYMDPIQEIPPPPPPPDAAPIEDAAEPLAEQEEPAAMIDPSDESAHAPSIGEDETPASLATDTSDQSTPSTSGQSLAVGSLLIGRYEIAQVLTESAEENTYQVIDHQGYQHCWNCGSEENSEGDEFCIACGASMLDIPYILHAYPSSTGGGGKEANVLQGAIVNTFMDEGRTYAVEQPSLNQSAFPNGVLLLAATNSDAGNVRRSDPNEDSTLVLQLHRVHESISTPSGIFIVADGLGGHDDGQLASRMAVNVIAERIARDLLGAPLLAEKTGAEFSADEEKFTALVQGTIEDANLAICQKNQQEKTDMGSTLTGFMIVGEHAYVVNVGDSRTYMVRGGQIYQLTTDHSLVGQLVAGGLIEPDDIYTHPQRSQIFRSLGDKPNVQVDVFKQQLHPGDILLSCSDGLWEMVRNPQIESILNNAADPQTACAQLIETANTNGGEDNVSAVVVFVR